MSLHDGNGSIPLKNIGNCWGLFSCCSKLQFEVYCGEKEATARSTEEVEDAGIERLMEVRIIKIMLT